MMKSRMVQHFGITENQVMLRYCKKKNCILLSNLILNNYYYVLVFPFQSFLGIYIDMKLSKHNQKRL